VNEHWALKGELTAAEGQQLGLSAADLVDGGNGSYHVVPVMTVTTMNDFLRQHERVADGGNGNAGGGAAGGGGGRKNVREAIAERQAEEAAMKVESERQAAEERSSAEKRKRAEKEAAVVSSGGSPVRKVVSNIRKETATKEKAWAEERQELEAKLENALAQLREAGERESALETENKGLHDQVDLLLTSSRWQLANADYREVNDEWYKFYTGFISAKHMVAWASIFWPNLEVSYGIKKKDNLTLWERLTLAYMRLHRDLEVAALAIFWGVSEWVVRGCVSYWVPRIGRIGLFLSDLDVTPEFMTAAMPRAFVDAGMGTVAAMVDGKDFETETPRQEPQLARQMYSDKSHAPAFRQLQWTLPCGLGIYASPACLGRASETAIVESCGKINKAVPFTPVAAGAQASPFPKAVARYPKEKSSKAADPVTEEDVDDEAAQQNAAPAIGSVPTAIFAEALSWFGATLAREQPKYAAVELGNASHDVFRHGPNSSSKDKEEQVLLLLRVAQAYEEHKIGKSLIAYYCVKNKAFLELCATALSGGVADVPALKQALGKFPAGWSILGDRGFFNHETLYPNWNLHLTPHFLEGRTQFTKEEVSADAVTCKLRYGAEVVYSRLVQTNFVRPIVPYGHFNLFQHALHWAQGKANMMQPIQAPTDYEVEW